MGIGGLALLVAIWIVIFGKRKKPPEDPPITAGDVLATMRAVIPYCQGSLSTALQAAISQGDTSNATALLTQAVRHVHDDAKLRYRVNCIIISLKYQPL